MAFDVRIHGVFFIFRSKCWTDLGYNLGFGGEGMDGILFVICMVGILFLLLLLWGRDVICVVALAFWDFFVVGRSGVLVFVFSLNGYSSAFRCFKGGTTGIDSDE